MSEWISVKDQLPPANRLIITENINLPRQRCYVCRYRDDGAYKYLEIQGTNSQMDLSDITHWMLYPALLSQ